MSRDWSRHSPYSDPGSFAPLLDALPGGVRELSAVVRNVLVHYRAAGIVFTGERLAEIDNRWVDRILGADQGRFPVPLAVPRPVEQRVVGCCRDFTLLTVAALRQRGVAARSRVGFASYLVPGFHCDHVVVEYRDGDRWVWLDAQLDPALDWGFDTADIPWAAAAPGALFASAAQVWSAYRGGAVDVGRYGVDPSLPQLAGGWLVYDYVLQELAHRQGDELLLWDGWGAMAQDLAGADLALADDVAAMLLAADAGDESAERELSAWYAADPRLRPSGRVRCLSPRGTADWVELRG
ncbi:transglutaminase domain-containing protein [Catellatospora sp. NPDC049609]|uniref:transglutaminase domain-containing protein n=1 Tax=Catellatospora sp. NPDC049609 TaxID=3155505 RepID=UPI0034326993